MGKKRAKERPAPRRPWRVIGLVVMLLIAAAGALFWWRSEPLGAAAGTPRLVVDREVVDLGSFRFDTTARVEFTLANQGDGVLRLAGIPRVKAVQGC